MSKLLVHQERSVIKSAWRPKGKCSSKKYIKSFSRL